MARPTAKMSPEELKAKRRRERWNALLTPFITLASIVLSVSMLMFLIKACNERMAQKPAMPPRPFQQAPR